MLSAFFLNCQPKLDVKKPDNLIPKDKMADVLSDMFVVTTTKGTVRIKFEKAGINPEKFILDKHNIDSLQFALSNNYYAHDIETYKEIIEEVKAKLTEQKQFYEDIDKKDQEEKRRQRDSLREAKQKLAEKGKMASKNRVKKPE